MTENHAAPQDVEGALFAGGSWKIDPVASKAEFTAKTFWGLLRVRGHFDDLDGWLEVGTGGKGEVRGELTINAASLDTGNARRDKHLRSPDFFDVEDHPTVAFKLTRVGDVGGGRARIVGILEAAGKATPLELDAEVSADRDGFLIEGEASVDPTIFGMNWSPMGMVRKDAGLNVQARLDPA